MQTVCAGFHASLAKMDSYQNKGGGGTDKAGGSECAIYVEEADSILILALSEGGEGGGGHGLFSFFFFFPWFVCWESGCSSGQRGNEM